jgi:phosphoribosylaminoimidazolecarboxamide formyltransferase/IMP cyclohydrolase
MSAFGGIVCFNRKVDRYTAEQVNEIFVELIFAPGYEEDALEVLQQKKNIRILDNQERRNWPVSEHDIKRVRGGILVQHRDEDMEMRDEMQVVTKRKPTEQEWGELLFAWKVAKHVRSNAIVLSKDLATVGIGAGQMSRVDSVRLAAEKAQQPLDGAALASDAFFPFADGPQLAVEAGVRSIIQPGGSQRDHEVVEACDAADVAMVFTSRRHFRH